MRRKENYKNSLCVSAVNIAVFFRGEKNERKKKLEAIKSSLNLNLIYN